jgi:hypothetical protein
VNDTQRDAALEFLVAANVAGNINVVEARIALGTASLGEWLGWRFPRLFKAQARRNAEFVKRERDLRVMRAETERLYQEVVAGIRARLSQEAAR